jgi:hypothetical protein
VRTLIAASDLMCATRLRKLAHVNMLYIGACDADGHHVF